MLCLIDVPTEHHTRTVLRKEVDDFVYEDCFVSKHHEQREDPSVRVSLELPGTSLTVHVMGQKAQSISQSDCSDLMTLEIEFWKLIQIYLATPGQEFRLRGLVMDLTRWSHFHGGREIQDGVAQLLGLKRDR